MSDTSEIIAIQNLVARFANSFDLKDWRGLLGCLAGEIDTDYSDLRGTQPETMSREKFVELRMSALQALRTHHLAGNLEIELDGTRASARVSMIIFRRNERDETFNTHCMYSLGFVRTSTEWTISSIVQKVFINDGQASVHKGILKP